MDKKEFNYVEPAVSVFGIKAETAILGLSSTAPSIEEDDDILFNL